MKTCDELMDNKEHKKYAFCYDDLSDRLMISCKDKEDVVIGSSQFMNLTLDFTSDNRVVGVEIKGISKMLKSLEINPDILNKLTGAELVFKQIRGGYLIYFLLKTKEGIER